MVAGPAGDGAATAVEGDGVEDAGLAGGEIEARGEWGFVDEEEVVEEVVLLDGPPCLGVAQGQFGGGAIGVCDRDGAVRMWLHWGRVVPASRR